jgi:hypothetical protein
MKLDVGCGGKPRGDVNCDLFKDYTPQDKSQRNLTKIPHGNFVQCDAQFLPFRESVFERVLCFHVIEHVKNPYLLLGELIRVSSGTVLVKCPHRFSKGAKMPYHRNYFNVTWFRRNLQGLKIEVKTSRYNFPRSDLVLLRLPNEITVKIEKTAKK